MKISYRLTEQEISSLNDTSVADRGWLGYFFVYEQYVRPDTS